MESMAAPSSATLPSLSLFPSRLSLSSKSRVACKREDERDSHSDSVENKNLPIISDRSLSLSRLSKDGAMGVVLSAAAGRGWTTGSGMEGPSASESESESESVSTFPWSLFTKSPRRRMLVAFTCSICSQRTTRAINPHAYTDGTVFVQCCGCNAYHKLVDHLNLFQETNCYLNSSFNYKGGYMDIDDHRDDIFPIS